MELIVPRNRMIKVDFWSDEKIGGLSNDAKLLFIGMWNYCDDSGVCRSNPTYLKSQLYPYSDFSSEKISEWLDELEDKNLILQVTHSSERFCIVPNFLKHQKIRKPSEFKYIPDISQAVPCKCATSAPLVRTKEKEKVKVKVKESPAAKFDFESIYQEYPRKEGKKKGMEKIRKRIKTNVDFTSFCAAVRNYAKLQSIKGTEEQYIKTFQTFSNCWEDYETIDDKGQPIKTPHEQAGEFLAGFLDD